MEGKPCQLKLAVLFLHVVVGQEPSIRAKEESTPDCVETCDDFPNSFYVITPREKFQSRNHGHMAIYDRLYKSIIDSIDLTGSMR